MGHYFVPFLILTTIMTLLVAFFPI
jgi:hypothetical protein